MLGNMSLSAELFEQTIVQCDALTGVFDAATLLFASLTEPVTEFGSTGKFDDDIECNDCKLDVEIKPGGGSTPSAISMARCKRAFLSQSSIEYSSDANLHRNVNN